jgi:diacylglycerol kinase (ATP)
VTRSGITKARLIVNPKSGADQAPVLLPLVNARLRGFVGDLDITLTEDAHDAERAAVRAVNEGCEALFVAGGDGTLNLALRGLASVPGAFERLTLGIIPFGTGNDFARALGLGVEPEPALDAIVQRRVAAVDIGLLNGRPFINTSAGGFVADVSKVVTEGLKDVTGRLAYIIGGARALFGSEAFTARLTAGDATGAWRGDLDVQMFAICNSRTIGGGYPIAPGARIDDGQLEVFVVRRMPTLEFVGLLQRIAMGEHQDDERVLHFRASAFTLEFDRRVRVNTDGELLEASRCEYRVLHRAVRFFAGADGAFTPADSAGTRT